MKTATYTTANIPKQFTKKQTDVSKETKVIFVPTLVDLRAPVKNGLSIFQFRRQICEALEGLISGAVSLR